MTLAIMNFGSYDSSAQFKQGENYAQYERQTYTAYYLDTNYNFDRSKSGTETVWDFSDAKIDVIDTFGNSFFDAADIYYSKQFPGANTVFYNEVYNTFDFFESSGTQLIKAGNITMDETGNKIISISITKDPDTVYNYPIYIKPPSLSTVRRIQKDKLHDLYISMIDSTVSEIETSGDLKLPYGDFKNVFKKNYSTTQYGIVTDSNKTIVADLFTFIDVSEWVPQFNAYPPLLSVCHKELYFKVKNQKEFKLLSYNYYVRGFAKNDSAVSTIRELKVSDLGNNQVAVTCILSKRYSHQITVYDITGKKTDMKLVNALPDESYRCSTVFNMADYAAGIYFFKVQNEKEFNTIKWIKR